MINYSALRFINFHSFILILIKFNNFKIYGSTYLRNGQSDALTSKVNHENNSNIISFLAHRLENFWPASKLKLKYFGNSFAFFINYAKFQNYSRKYLSLQSFKKTGDFHAPCLTT